MAWKQLSRGFRFDPIARGSPEALVVLLHDLGSGAAKLTSLAARWAAAVPTTAFIALDGTEQLDPSSCDSVEPARLDRAVRHLEPLITQQLRDNGLELPRLVLVGFGYGGTLALHMLLRRGWDCAGVLAFGARLKRPLPRVLRITGKVRLIDCVDDRNISHTRLRDSVALLIARGIDVRGVLLVGSVMSDETIRHGGAYLVELVGTAQRGNGLRLHLESRLAH
jgi:phospholipase/carboxylesterase